MLFERSGAREPSSYITSAAVRPRSPLSALFADRAVEELDVGETLFWQGDTGIDVFEILEGALRLVCVLADGRRVVTGFVFAGELGGASSPKQYVNSAEALVPTKIRRCDRIRFAREVSRDPELHCQLLGQLRREIAAVRRQVVLLACKTAEERVSSFLLSMAWRTGGYSLAAGVMYLPMTRPDIADYLGLTRETVSRAMTELRRKGLIAQMDRNTVVVIRPERLARLAAEDRDIVQDECARSNWEEERCPTPTPPNLLLIGA